ncbi:MAG: hypothetical protein ACM3KD_08305 [Hyphomicrobiaceae bacterium]
MTRSRASLLACCAAALFQPTTSIAADTSGAMPGDEAMTCQQIAAELAPYARQMAPDINALAQTEQQIIQRSQARTTEAAPTSTAVSAGAIASSLDPTGLSSKAYGQAEVALQQQMWNRATAEDKPLMDQANRQTNALAGKAMAMQSDARMQRLMALAKQKNCQ